MVCVLTSGFDLDGFDFRPGIASTVEDMIIGLGAAGCHLAPVPVVPGSTTSPRPVTLLRQTFIPITESSSKLGLLFIHSMLNGDHQPCFSQPIGYRKHSTLKLVHIRSDKQDALAIDRRRNQNPCIGRKVVMTPVARAP